MLCSSRNFRREPIFIFKILSYYKIHRLRPKLEVLESVEIIQKFLWTCQARKNSANRIYNLFLLIGQVLSFTASRRTSAKEAPSSALVTRTQKEYRKMIQREHQAATVLPPKFPLLKEEEYETLRSKCETFLYRIGSLSAADRRKCARDYMHHLILLTLVSVATPRHQIFALMERHHLVWHEEEESYQIIFDGSNPPLKNGKAILLLLPRSLGCFYKVQFFICLLTNLGMATEYSASISAWGYYDLFCVPK